MNPLILKAAEHSKPSSNDDNRKFWFGCLGVRNNDGVEVLSKNGSIHLLFSQSLNPNEMQRRAEYHAEGRVLKKMTKGGSLYVARVSRQTGDLILSRPCGLCRAKIRSYRIDKVYYSINNIQYGIWYPKEDIDKIVG